MVKDTHEGLTTETRDGVATLCERRQHNLVDYIEMFYNNRRRHSYLGNVSHKDFGEMQTLKEAA